MSFSDRSLGMVILQIFFAQPIQFQCVNSPRIIKMIGSIESAAYCLYVTLVLITNTIINNKFGNTIAMVTLRISCVKTKANIQE